MQDCVTENLWSQSIHQIALSLSELKDVLPPDTSPGFGSSVCLLGNILEVSGAGLSGQNCTLSLVSLGLPMLPFFAAVEFSNFERKCSVHCFGWS